MKKYQDMTKEFSNEMEGKGFKSQADYLASLQCSERAGHVEFIHKEQDVTDWFMQYLIYNFMV